MLFVLNCIVGGITPEGKSFLILPFPVTVGTSAEKDIEKQRNNINTRKIFLIFSSQVTIYIRSVCLLL